MRPLLFVFVVSSLVTTGCARSVAARGTGWWRVRSEHIDLTTDVEHDRAVTAGWAFEDLYRALERVFPSCDAPPLTEAVAVTMIARQDDYAAIGPAHTSGFFRPSAPGIVDTPPDLVLSAGAGAGGYFAQVFAHELTHRFVARCFADAPSWLHEGMARYFETIRVRAHDVVVGRAPYRIEGRGQASYIYVADGVQMIVMGRDNVRIPSELVPLTEADFRNPSTVSNNYAGAWALTHLLMLGPPALRARFTSFLGATRSAGGAASFATQFDVAALDGDFAQHLSHPLLESIVPYAPPPLADPPAVPLPEARAHLALAMFLRRADDAGLRAQAAEHLALAAADPATRGVVALAQLQLFTVPVEGSKASYLAALARELPDDLDVLSARADFEIARRRVTNEGVMLLAMLAARDDLRAIDLSRAADLALVLGRTNAAVEFGRRSVELSPSSSVGHLAFARALQSASFAADANREVTLGWLTAGHGAPLEHPPQYTEPTATVASSGDVDAADLAPTPLPATPDTSGQYASFVGEVRVDRRASTFAPDCVGFVGAPVAYLDVPENAPPVVVETVNTDDMVLVIRDAAGHVWCDDDSGGAQQSAIFGAWPAGRLEIRVGSFRPSEQKQAFRIGVRAAAGTFDPSSVPRDCDLATRESAYGPILVGTRVRLARHAVVPHPADAADDPIRDENWVPAMEAFVGHEARVTGRVQLDAAGCALVHVDADDGAWVWRVRDLLPPE